MFVYNKINAVSGKSKVFSGKLVYRMISQLLSECVCLENAGAAAFRSRSASLSAGNMAIRNLG